MSKEPLILSTKILPDDLKTLLIKAGIELLEDDFISITLQPAKFKQKETSPSVALFTSKNAVKALIEYNQIKLAANKTIFCVGNETRKLLESNGLEVEKLFSNSHLLALFIIQKKIKEVTLYCGNKRRQELPDLLVNSGVKFYENVVYQTELSPHHISKKVDGILFFSPSGVQSYLMNNDIRNQQIICIGETTKSEVLPFTKKIALTTEPQISSVINKAIEIFKTS